MCVYICRYRFSCGRSSRYSLWCICTSAGYNLDKELARTNIINKILKNPTFIRFDPYDGQNTIFKIIGEIHYAMSDIQS